MTCFWNISEWPGVDTTGLTQSNNAFNAILAQAAINVANGVPTTIVIDCPVLYSTSNIPGNSIFWPSGVNMKGTLDGMLINDQMAAPFLFFCNVQNIVFQDLHIRYNQPLNGTYMMNSNVSGTGTWAMVAGSFQSNYLGGTGGYLQQTDGVQYASGASPLWNGPSALTAFFNMRGNCSNISFLGCTFDIPVGASPAAFYYTLCQYAPEWLPNSVVIGNQSIATASWSSANGGTVTVTTASGKLSPFAVASQYLFYISGSIGSYAQTAVFVTVTSNSPTSANTFTYPLAINPGTYSGNGNYGTQTGAGSSAVPQNITWKDCTFDGMAMCHVGTGQVNFFDCIWSRYTDLQDDTNGVVTFQTVPTNGATSLTLSTAAYPSGWPYLGTQYWVTLNTGQMIGMTMQTGMLTCNSFVDPFYGNPATVIGTMLFSGAAPLMNATSGTLMGWTLGRGTFLVNFTNGQSNVVVTVNSVSPYTVFTASFAALTANCTSATQNLVLTVNATSGNVGGVPGTSATGYYLSASPYSPPPHAVYLGSSSGTYPYAHVIAKANLDQGVRVYNTPTSRTLENSGNACSFKCELGRGSIIDDWTSYRPDGGLDLQSFSGTLGSSVSNIQIFFNSATPLTDYINNTSSTIPGGGGPGVPVFGLRLPGPTYYNNLTMSNISIYDANPSPLRMPFQGTTFTPNQNLSITGVKVYMNDWGPPGAPNSNQPTILMAGSNITLDASIYYNSFSTTTMNIGFVANAPLQNSNIWIKHYGFRTPAITLAGTISNANTASISTANTTPPTPGCYPNGWPFNSGAVYKVIFADNSVRYCTITNSGTFPGGTITMTWPGAAVTASLNQLTGITAQGLYYQNFAGYKSRLFLPLTIGQTATRFRIEDYSNQYFQDAIDNAMTEVFSDSQNCTPPNLATSFTTAMTIPANLSIIALGIGTSTAFTGTITGYTVGYSGSLAAFATVSSPAKWAGTTNPTTFNPTTLASIATAATGTARTIVITPTGGNFDGIGTIQIAFRAQGSSMGS